MPAASPAFGNTTNIVSAPSAARKPLVLFVFGAFQSLSAMHSSSTILDQTSCVSSPSAGRFGPCCCDGDTHKRTPDGFSSSLGSRFGDRSRHPPSTVAGGRYIARSCARAPPDALREEQGVRRTGSSPRTTGASDSERITCANWISHDAGAATRDACRCQCGTVCGNQGDHPLV